MVSGAYDTIDHDVSISINLPEPGRWQVIKSETNLTDQTWVAMQATLDEDSTFVDDEDAMVVSRQFTKSFMTPDMRRLTFYDGEVRPGEALLKMYSLETNSRKPAYMHSRYSPMPDGQMKTPEEIERMIADGLPQRPVIEVIVPVTVIG